MITVKSVKFHWLLSTNFSNDCNALLVLANNKNKPLRLPLLHHLTDDEKNFLTSNNINWEYLDDDRICCLPNPNIAQVLITAPLYIARQGSDLYDLYGMYKGFWTNPRQIQKENELLESSLKNKILVPGCYVDMD